jgi:hypothetical protein
VLKRWDEPFGAFVLCGAYKILKDIVDSADVW